MNKNYQKIIAVFGYNNTRVYDLVKIKEIAKTDFNADLLLVKEGIQDQDREIANYCLDHKPEDEKSYLALEPFLKEHSLEIIACLPFSDKGVIGAAFAAQYYGLFSDDPSTANAMVSKSAFRQLEQSFSCQDDQYVKPFFYSVDREEALREILNMHKSFFLKPSSEGNSRGCMAIYSYADLDQWLAESRQYLSQGVICEQILSIGNEFSFDGVAGNYWITEKFTTTGPYRAEYQHIIPAPLPKEKAEHVHKILLPLLDHIGIKGGAIHHEFFLIDGQKIASVEPNRRPAGMWFWDLASWSFPGFYPWKQWIDQFVNGGEPKKKMSYAQKNYSGVRGVIARQSGVLKAVDEDAMLQKLLEFLDYGSFKLSILKKEGAKINSLARDNADFIAWIAIKNPSYDNLLLELQRAEEIILAHMRIQGV